MAIARAIATTEDAKVLAFLLHMDERWSLILF